MSYETVLEAT